MDAVNLSFKKTLFSVACALLLPAAAFAQPAFTLSQNSVNLLGSSPGTVTVTSTSNQIGFSATITADTDSWLCVNGSQNPVTGLTTPSTLNFSVCGQPSIFVTNHTATVTVNETDGAGTATATISLSYMTGSGGGGGSGTVSASPASINQTVSYGGSVIVSITLSTASSVPIGFSVGGTPSWISWYQSSGNPGLVSAAQSAVLNFTLNGAGQSQTSLTTNITISTNGTLTIPITLNNGVSGSGGSTGTGSLTVSPSSLSWSYSTANTGNFPSSTTLTMSSTNGAIQYSATASSSNGWLLINNSYTASGTVGVTPLTISPSTNLAALTPGTTYQGTVTISASDGSSASVTVSATVNGTNSTSLTISPNPIALSAPVNGPTTQTNVSITSAVSGILTVSTSGAGLSVSGSNQNVTAGVPVNVTVFGNPSGLVSQTVQGYLNVNVAGNAAQAQINFVVGSGSNTGGGTAAAATPGQLTFYYEPNTSMQTSQLQQAYLSGSGNITVTSSTANSSINWLSVSVQQNSLPTTLYVTANATGLASSTYQGTVTITNTTTGQVTTVSTALVVSGTTTLYASPGDYVFNYIANTTSLAQVVGITVGASDGTPVPFTATVLNSSSTPWLSVSPGSGTAGIGLSVTANASNLANGVYSGSIQIAGGNNALTIPIVLVVTGSSVSGGSGSLTLSQSAVTLQSANGSPMSQQISVNATTTTTFNVSASGAYNGITWLSVSPSGSTVTPQTLTITANPAGLPANTNLSGTVSLTANGVTQTVNVSFIVGTGGTGPSNSVVVTANSGTSTSPSLTFAATAANQTLQSQYLTITSASGSSATTFTVTASTTSGGNWIQLSTVAGTQYQTPINALTVTANTTGLGGGTYNGTITISPVGGTAVTVPVTLTITGSPAIAVSTTALSFAYQAGSTTPAAQTVQVTVASGGTSGSFTATAASTPAGWLAVSPSSGTAPGALSVSITPTGLAAGTYTGTITVAGSSGTTGSATVTVTLTITAPLPTITTVVNAASFVNEAISPGEIITIGGASIGPGTPASFTLSGNLVPTTLAGVQVLISGYPAPLLYVSSNQINAIVPYEIAGILNPSIIVKFVGQSSNGYTVNAAATAPGIFTANGSGTGPGAILNADYSLNVTAATARGGVVQVFLTGEGQTSPAGVDGKVTAAPYPSPLLPIAITVGGQPTTYQFAGEAPGLVSGVLQLNVVIPPTLTVTGNVPLNVSIGSNSTQGGVTVNIK